MLWQSSYTNHTNCCVIICIFGCSHRAKISVFIFCGTLLIIPLLAECFTAFSYLVFSQHYTLRLLCGFSVWRSLWIEDGYQENARTPSHGRKVRLRVKSKLSELFDSMRRELLSHPKINPMLGSTGVCSFSYGNTVAHNPSCHVGMCLGRECTM